MGRVTKHMESVNRTSVVIHLARLQDELLDMRGEYDKWIWQHTAYGDHHNTCLESTAGFPAQISASVHGQARK